ncbi:hypothetical protein DXU06_16455 [Bradyrhizobium elkanii]|nr:hypothetical protein [Bradyrhizobium elkanii]RYM18850.1 hypothetical protein EWH13_34210 [Bradyrhizobium elkanii]GEC57992.1 hypothetical protein BEL01nite_70350 [Bradyrhizobium elkanii]
MTNRTQKITVGEMRAEGVSGVLIYCTDFTCSHWITRSAEDWPDSARLSDLEQQYKCNVCGRVGVDIRPNFETIVRIAPK